MTLTSWRAPGSANTHQTNCHRNDIYQAICLKLSLLVCIKLIVNIRLFQRNRICTFDFIDKVHELFAFPSYIIYFVSIIKWSRELTDYLEIDLDLIRKIYIISS